jgi:phosphatidate cytidylyltransferase
MSSTSGLEEDDTGTLASLEAKDAKPQRLRLNLPGRVRSGLVLYPLFGVLIWLGGIPLLIFIIAISLLASREFYNLIRRIGYEPSEFAGSALAVCFVVFGATAMLSPLILPILIALIVFFSTDSFFVPRPKASRICLDSVFTVCGAIYTGALLGYGYAIRQLPNGFGWLLAIMLGITNCDNAALWIGKSLGRHRIAPAVSPNKTWEGFVAGLLGAFFSIGAVSALFQLTSIWHVLGLSLVIWLLDIVGDLAESKLKRRAGVKDSGTLLPGMGGALDRIDSWVTTLPVAYLYLRWIVSV